jgi:phosphoglycolate phosphatase-like HAD superfamily hydrolase
VNPHDQQHIIVTGTPQGEIEHILKAIDLVSPFSKVFGAPHTKPLVLAEVLEDKKNGTRPMFDDWGLYD